jgi:hypothetical protein
LGIDSIPLRAGGVWHTIGKLSTRATTLLETSTQSEVYTQSQNCDSANFGNFETPTWKSRERHIVYYKGEGGGFPQVQAVVSLVSPNCPWFVLAPKVLQLCTNRLVLVLCRSVWIVKACQFFLVPSRNSSMPLYPSKVLWTRERAPTPCPSVVLCLGLTFESLKELGTCQGRT